MISKNCSNCGTPFLADRKSAKYCSRSCAAKVNNKAYPKRKSDRKVYPQSCASCEQKFWGDSSQKCCSLSCAAKFRSQRRIQEWIKNNSSGWYGHQVPEAIRRFLLEESNYRCTMILDTGVRCGENRRNADGRSILQIDHVDGNPTNNIYSNLRVLCPSCHATTPNFGSRNVGSGRAWRRKQVPVAEK